MLVFGMYMHNGDCSEFMVSLHTQGFHAISYVLEREGVVFGT